MTEQMNLVSRWSARRESVEMCASRAVECLRRLALCDEVFKQWYAGEGAKSLKQILEDCKLEPSIESVRSILAKGRHRRDVDQSVIEELGFAATLWNGGVRENRVHMAMFCGAYSESVPGANQCIIDLPYGSGAADRVLRMEVLLGITGAMALSWDSDWARVSTYDMDQILYPQDRYQGQKVGWLTYLSDRCGRLPSLPDDCEVTRIEGFGNLIVIKGIDRVTASNPAHVESVRRLSEALSKAGLLSPTPAAKEA